MANQLIHMNGKDTRCQICMQNHVIMNNCRKEDVAKRMGLLVEANSHIPGIMKANKEATELATHFQDLVKQSNHVHEILLGVLASHGEIGETIRKEYMGKVDTWVKEHLNPDTGQLKLGIEPSTSKETEDKGSTEVTTIGGISPNAS